MGETCNVTTSIKKNATEKDVFGPSISVVQTRNHLKFISSRSLLRNRFKNSTTRVTKGSALVEDVSRDRPRNVTTRSFV